MRKRRYLKLLVTSHARSEPPQLGQALERIRDAKEAELSAATSPAPSNKAVPSAGASGAASTTASNGTTAGTSGTAAGAAGTSGAATAGAASSAEAALRHLLLYVDADELYRTALGLYDLPLAYMVAVHAQVWK